MKKMIIGFDVKPIEWVEAKRDEYHVYFSEDVKDAVQDVIEKANALDNLETRGHILEIIQSSFPEIFDELKRETFLVDENKQEKKK